jgi:meiotic recombination protein SPO11
MVLKVRKIKSWNDCEVNNEILSQKESSVNMRTINSSNRRSERNFTIISVVACEIYKMLSRNMMCTKRELYYRDVDLFGKQESVNKAIETLCSMLSVQEYELGVLSSSKGLVAGDLIINIGEERIDCSTAQSVPQNPSEISSLESSAEYILIVEKDTVFQRLINENIFGRIGHKIVLITAKGYPDVNTRVLLKRIQRELKIKMYILVDADPHGIEIMLTYKFGSISKIHNAEHLAVPSIEWIG